MIHVMLGSQIIVMGVEVHTSLVKLLKHWSEAYVGVYIVHVTIISECL